MTEVEDSRLVREFLEGDREAFALILRKYEKPLFNLVYGMVNHYEDARDLTQQVFAKAAGKLGQFNPDYRLFSWLYRISVNETLNFLNRVRRFEPVTGLRFADRSNPETQLMTREFETQLRRALMRIDPRYRVLILLKHLEGCSYREISRMLSIPEKTVKSRLFTGRRLLYEDLNRRGLLKSHGRTTG